MDKKNNEAILEQLWKVDKALCKVIQKAKKESDLKEPSKKLAKLEERLINIMKDIENITYD